jgi:protein-S-isoprenylcysteine O-methyltransferase Ste14
MDLGIVIMTVSLVWLGSEVILARMKHSLATDERSDKYSLRVLWTTIAASVTVGVFVGTLHIGSTGWGSRVFPIAGIVMIVLGLLLRWIAILSLKRQFTVDVAIRKDHQIVRDGIYRFVRHPAYAGSLLSFFGLGFCFANVICFVITFFPICAAFLYRIRVEERALIAAFGDDYSRYAQSTKRLIPGVF